MLAMLRVKRTRPALAETLEQLADVGAVEVQRVGVALAVDGVVAVARVPVEAVVAAAEQRGIGAEVAVHDVVAAAADQRLRAGATEQRVVAGAAVDRDRLVVDRGGEQRHLVVAASRGDRDRGEGALVEGEVDRAVGADVDRQLGAVGNEDQMIARAVAGEFQGSGLDLPRVARHRGGRQAERRQGRTVPANKVIFITCRTSTGPVLFPRTTRSRSPQTAIASSTERKLWPRSVSS